LLDHTVKWDLTADQIDEQGNGSPNQFVIEMLLNRNIRIISNKGMDLPF